MMFYKKTYTKKESAVKHYKKTDSSNDLLEDLGDTIDRVRRYVWLALRADDLTHLLKGLSESCGPGQKKLRDGAREN